MSETPPNKMPWFLRMLVGKNPLYTLFRALVWALLLLVVFKFVLLGVRVKGESMEPNFHEGQVRFINRLAYLRKPPQRGDVVSFRMDDSAVILKRIVALPGETLTILAGGRIFIDGKPLEEAYPIKGKTSFQAQNLKLEPNQYWLIGDNRTISDQYLKFDYQILGRVLSF